MNSAVSSYAWHGPAKQGSQAAPSFAGGALGGMSSTSSKRKRVESGEEYGHRQGSVSWDQQAQTQQAAHPAYAHAPQLIASYPNASASGEYAAPAAPVRTDTAPSGAAGAVDESSTNPASHWHAASRASSSYPDVSYSQQPYFYQQADPNTYNSAWQPPPDAPSFGTQASSYSVSAPTANMPFFPPSQSAPEAGETTYETNTSSAIQPYQRDVESTSQYTYPPSNDGAIGAVLQQPPQPQQQRSDAPNAQSALYFEDASMHLKIQSLSILENLATQLIHTIAKASFPQIQEIMRGNETEDSQAYNTLKNLFDQTRKVYSRETPFIDAIAIQMFQPNQQETIRKANIATFISSILGAHDVSFFHLNEFFMETFVPLGHRLLKWQGAIYLELKTQTYISALINSDGNPGAMLDELFPPDLDAQILTRHPDAPSLSPSEQDFIDRSRARKSYLLAEDSTEEALRELPKKYQWNDFVREFASCISKNVDGIMNVPARSQPVFGSGASDRRGGAGSVSLSGGQAAGGRNGLPNVQGFLNDQGVSSGQRDSNEGVKKSTAAASTIRQPWTKPEEDALLNGLERVNGPHWSQILALYGRGGSISEVLKDRNQVQLKDKARNLKLWYLKMGKDVPPALRGVTGELRKRGGARARAALGITDDDDGDPDAMDADAEGDGDGIDPSFERSQSRGKVKKTKKKA